VQLGVWTDFFIRYTWYAAHHSPSVRVVRRALDSELGCEGYRFSKSLGPRFQEIGVVVGVNRFVEIVLVHQLELVQGQAEVALRELVCVFWIVHYVKKLGIYIQIKMQ
jgi:hypothetical protein